MNSPWRLVPAAFSLGFILPALIACGGGDKQAPPGQSRELTRAVETAQKSLESGKVAEAAQQFDAAIEQGASSAEAYGGRGAARIQQADYSGAIADLTRAIELDARSDTYLENRAIAQTELFKKGGDPALLAQAIKDADASARLKPDRIGPIFARAEAYFLNKEYERALTDLTECVKRSDRFRRAWLLKGMTNLALGRTADARSDFEKVVNLDPTGQEGIQAQAELAKLK